MGDGEGDPDSPSNNNSLQRLTQGNTLLPTIEDLPDLPELSGLDRSNPQFDPFFKQACMRIEKFTKDWNANDANRDKSIQVLRGVVATKDHIQENLNLMLDRNGKIEEALLKGEQLQVVANRYKKATT